MELINVWDFVTKYFPSYFSSDEIARNEDLHKVILNEGDDILNKEFNNDMTLARLAYYESLCRIYEKSIRAFISEKRNTIDISWSVSDVLQNAEDEGISITKEDAKAILEMVERDFDAMVGVNWMTITDKTIEYLEIKNNNKEQI